MPFEFDQDVFFVDSGDQTHGGGLSDADSPAGAKVTMSVICLKRNTDSAPDFSHPFKSAI